MPSSISASVGLGVGLQQGRRGHDLARLAVAALGHVLGRPGLLHRVAAVGRQALDGGDLFPDRVLHRQDAGARRHPVDLHRAGAALGDAAAELGAGQPDLVAQDPEQRRVGLDVEVVAPSIDGEGDHAGASRRRVFFDPGVAPAGPVLPAAVGRAARSMPAARLSRSMPAGVHHVFETGLNRACARPGA